MDKIVIYDGGKNGKVKIDVSFEDETVWLTQKKMAELYNVSKSTINEHIKNIFDSGELEENATVRNFRTVQKEGTRTIARNIEHYNLDMIISVGYRVNSKEATIFRQWATQRLKEYMIKGFTMDDERLKELGGANYWKELLDRIRDIRSSEKVLYRQVLDLYATAVDYDSNSNESRRFFAIVQNKLHYAITGNTAAELIYKRVDSKKEFMGLTNFKGDLPIKRETEIAKNYLNEKELKVLNNLVSGYFDFAEIQAIEHNPMKMLDYIKHLDDILVANKKPVLKNDGKITHNEAMEKAHNEYKKYQQNTLSDVEKAYLETIKNIERKKIK